MILGKLFTSLIILTSFVLTWFITEKSHFLKNSKIIFLLKWAEILCVPKGHMWDSLCEITANFVNPPCLGEVNFCLKFTKSLTENYSMKTTFLGLYVFLTVLRIVIRFPKM